MYSALILTPANFDLHLMPAWWIDSGTYQRKQRRDFVLSEVRHAQKLFFMQKTIDYKNYSAMFIYGFFVNFYAKISVLYFVLLTLFSKLDIMPSFCRICPLRRGMYQISM